MRATPSGRSRRAVQILVALALVAALGSCDSKKDSPRRGLPARTYRMGFMGIPPAPDTALAVQALQMWVPRADAAIHHVGAPWDSMFAGVPLEPIILREIGNIANYYRSLGLKFVLSLDATDGLNRAADDPALVAAGRSLTEPAIQQLMRRYAVLCDSILQPDVLVLASETNLVRLLAPTALYNALVTYANDAAGDVRARNSNVILSASVQVETAWGRLGGPGTYEGISSDLVHFPFAQWIGLSSYPYFSWEHPDSLPLNYYSRLREGLAKPMFVIEGGWASAGPTLAPSSAAIQAAYIRRHAQILDEVQARYWFQLTFTDIDTSQVPPGVNLTPFAFNGMVDKLLIPKLALSEWDANFARPLQP
ncbi:MAG: hypothetical protein HOP12_03700 [Candidatus Eisenbacteria bacterium]|uniref:Arabinogalactan endo-beta-1,4-galactanase n=1 Tax=Eiseniibacteriota bacterium TaxID=2212470 RepID=A0A849SFL3_UNCEI|nr:hypothetical protein [Candidatus Eisenbacteria bacterium]